MKESIFDILELLEETPGRLDKEEILHENVNNDLLRRAFVAAGDPYTVYHVNKFRMPRGLDDQDMDDDVALKVFLNELLPALSSREITGNSAKDAVIDLFSYMTEHQQKWCQRILLKKLRCGVQESTINKIWSGALKSFSVALAETLKSEFVEGKGISILGAVSYPVRVEPKLDGLRCIAVKQAGAVTFYTRNGTILETMPTIRKTLESAEYDNVVLDAEALGKDWGESASVLMSYKSKHDDSNIILHVFDAMPADDWFAQECKLSYNDRAQLVTDTITKIVKNNHQAPIMQVPHIVAKGEKELLTFFQKCMDEQFEGVMLKTVNTPYEFKRSKNILKLKPVVTYEGVIVTPYEGRRGTKWEGLFNGFEILLPNGVITKVGSGLNDAIRAQVQLEGPETYMGRIVEIEAQPDPMTADGLTVDGKARFPVFIRFRDEADVDPKVMSVYEEFCKQCRMEHGVFI